MSDDKKPEGNVNPVELGTATPAPAKVWDNAEVQKIIAERQEAKERLRKIDEDTRKASEAKAVEEGRTKELLAEKEKELEQLRKFKESIDAEQSAIRQQALSKLTDEDREIAAELSTAKLLAFVERQTKQTKTPPASVRGASTDAAESTVAFLPGESAEAYAARMKKIGKAR